MNIRDKDTVDNLFADVIIKLLENVDKFDPEQGAASTWVVTVTRRKVMDYIRDIKRSEDVMDSPRVSVDDKVPGSTVAIVDNIPDEQPSEAYKQRRLEEFLFLISDLPRVWQQILKLRLVYGHSLKEISDMLDLKYKAVDNAHTKAIKRLKNRVRVEREPRWHYGQGVTLQDMYNPLPPIYKFPFKLRVVEGKTWQQVQQLIDLPIHVLEARVNVARDMIFKKWNVEV
jgi:RNA polymerase sigma factor (sigma-70 family)